MGRFKRCPFGNEIIDILYQMKRSFGPVLAHTPQRSILT
jgi:hypothetical protein